LTTANKPAVSPSAAVAGKPRVLVAWIGHADLDGPKEDATKGVGPIAQALRARVFDRALLLSDYSPEVDAPFLAWLATQTAVTLEPFRRALRSPTHFGDIYEAARAASQRCPRQESRYA